MNYNYSSGIIINIIKCGGICLMKIVTYMCDDCLEPYDYDSDKGDEFLCPKCGHKMTYLNTEEIDPNTNKVINSYQESRRKQNNPGEPISVSTSPVVECPYCHSTNTKKITTTSKVAHTAFFGLFSISRNSKQWHCNQCGSDF